VTYALLWEPVSFGEGTVTGSISLDINDSRIMSFYAGEFPPWVTDLTVEVSGATVGNGVFNQNDYNWFYRFVWNPTGITDFETELIGQGGWGSDSGVFVLMSCSFCIRFLSHCPQWWQW
jgi:hypothetical protein